MSDYVWRRQNFTSNTTNLGSWWIDAIGAGHTYVRCHFRWGFYGDSPFEVDMQSYADIQVTWGLVTTYGNGTETPPDPVTHSNDQDPPAQRWIYWETRSVYPTAMSQPGGVITWRDTGSSEFTDTKAMVKAASPPAGDTLNLWATWKTSFNWSGDTGNSTIWMMISDLSYVPS